MTVGSKEATVFGEKVTIDVAPVIVNDRTMLPARFVAEALGATVKWATEEQRVTVLTEDIMVVMYISGEYAYINGEQVILDSPPFIENDRTYTPVRFIAEALGASVEWDGANSTATITKGNKKEGFSYQTADMSEYVKLGKYTGFTFDYTEPEEITDEDVEEYIYMETGGFVQVTDEFVNEKFGFETVEEYKAYIKEMLCLDRDASIMAEKSSLVLEKVIAESEIVKYPEGLLEEKLAEQIETVMILVEAYGMTYEEYLALSGTTQEEFEASLLAEVETALKEEVVVMAIVNAEGLYATYEDCDAMMLNDLMKAYELSSIEELCDFYMVPEKVLYEMTALTVSKYKGLEFLAASSVFE